MIHHHLVLVSCGRGLVHEERACLCHAHTTGKVPVLCTLLLLPVPLTCMPCMSLPSQALGLRDEEFDNMFNFTNPVPSGIQGRQDHLAAAAAGVTNISTPPSNSQHIIQPT